MIPLHAREAINRIKKDYQYNKLDADELIRRIFLIGAGAAYLDWFYGIDNYDEIVKHELKRIAKETGTKIKLPKLFEEMPKFEYDLQEKPKKRKRQTLEEAQEEKRKEEVDSIKANLKHEERSLKLQNRLKKARKGKKPRKKRVTKDTPSISKEEGLAALEKYKAKYDEVNKDA